MVKEAEAHKAEDDKHKEDIETKNKAIAYISQIDETLKSDNPNVTQQQKDEVKKLRDELQEAVDKDDMASLKTKLDALEQAANTMAQQMYQQQGAAGAQGQPNDGGAAGANPNNSDDVVDADFKEKKN